MARSDADREAMAKAGKERLSVILDNLVRLDAECGPLSPAEQRLNNLMYHLCTIVEDLLHANA